MYVTVSSEVGNIHLGWSGNDERFPFSQNFQFEFSEFLLVEWNRSKLGNHMLRVSVPQTNRDIFNVFAAFEWNDSEKFYHSEQSSTIYISLILIWLRLPVLGVANGLSKITKYLGKFKPSLGISAFKKSIHVSESQAPQK